MASRDELVKSYNQSVKTLLKIVNNKYENKNKDILEVSRMLNRALDVDYNVIIEDSGPYLIEHSDALEDLDSFVDNTDFDSKADKFKTDSGKNMFKNIIDSIKTIWKTMEDDEKTIITKLIKKMMIDYSKYATSKAN